MKDGSERLAQPASPQTAAESPRAADAMPRKLATNASILGDLFGQRSTFDTHRPADADGKPLPWFTYPAIEYLRRYDCRGWNVFEYGAGNSTLYWSARGANVASVERDNDWYKELKNRNIERSQLIYEQDRDAYVGAIGTLDRLFDVIVVDGVWREHCISVCLEFLRPGGFLILDNSDWYHEAAAGIRKRGFFEISFSGFGPVNDYTWTTSFFIRWVSPYQTVFLPPDPIGGSRLGPEARDELW